MTSICKQMESSFEEELMKLGCSTRKEAAIAVQVYLDLCEVKKYWDVEYHFDDKLKCAYVTAKKTKSSPTLVFVPISTFDGISFDDMRKYLVLDESGNKSVHLAIADSDSTCLYYQITDGITAPTLETHEETVKDQRVRLDGELRKHRKTLEQAALYNIPITLSKK